MVIGGDLTLKPLSRSTHHASAQPTAVQNLHPPLCIPWRHILDHPRLPASLDSCRIQHPEHQHLEPLPSLLPPLANFHSGAPELKVSGDSGRSLQRPELANGHLFQVTGPQDFLTQV